jgi:uncharacterized protein (DUF58 family)
LRVELEIMTSKDKNWCVTPDFLQKLELLQILSKKVIRGSVKGERTSAKKGRSVEFADYRNYSQGDEIRIIDWNVYGRLDKLFVKLFAEEEELNIYLLVDCSLSMDFGSPSKLDYAKKISASLAYISLANFDRVALGLINTGFSGYRLPLRGKNQVFRIFDYLEKLSPEGKTSISDSLRQFTQKKLRPGLVIIISDFLDPSDFIDSLKLVRYHKHDLFLVQVLDEEEINPSIGGDIRFVDVETGEKREVTVTSRLLEMYKENLNLHCDTIESFCRKSGAGYIVASTSIPFEDLVLRYFRSGRLLR